MTNPITADEARARAAKTYNAAADAYDDPATSAFWSSIQKERADLYKGFNRQARSTRAQSSGGGTWMPWSSRDSLFNQLCGAIGQCANALTRRKADYDEEHTCVNESRFGVTTRDPDRPRRATVPDAGSVENRDSLEI